MPRSKPQSTWTALLLKKEYDETNAIRSSILSISHYDVVVGGKRIGSMHVPPRRNSPPGWLKRVKPFVPKLPSLMNSMASTAVILLPVGTRTFALTLGYGRTLLQHDAFEDDFGLKVTLNVVPPGNIRVIDRHSFDAFAHQTRTQGIRTGGLEQFGLDMEQDILRAVIGTPADPALGTRVAGKDALVLTARTELAELPDLLARCLTQFRSRAYQSTYPDLDKLAVVRDEKLLAQLEQRLLKKIRDGDHERLWLAVPDFVDWATVGFRYSTASYDPYPDLHLADFLGRLRIDLDKLELGGRRVHCVDLTSDVEKESWALRACAYCELVLGGATYVLSNGAWYQIDAAFVAQVDQAVNRLLEKTTLPDYLKTDKDEAAYNKRVAKTKGYFRFDRRNVYHGGRRGDQIEPCDLLTKERELIHVKRYGGSSVLSHLFAQGLVSSDLFVDEATYREKMRNKVSDAAFKALIPETVDASAYKVVYAIVGRPAGKKRLAEMLPFFSRVTLRRTAKQLKRMGYGVAVQWVTNTSPDA